MPSNDANTNASNNANIIASNNARQDQRLFFVVYGVQRSLLHVRKSDINAYIAPLLAHAMTDANCDMHKSSL